MLLILGLSLYAVVEAPAFNLTEVRDDALTVDATVLPGDDVVLRGVDLGEVLAGPSNVEGAGVGEEAPFKEGPIVDKVLI